MRSLNARQAQKLGTRRRVIEAARDLFDSDGYQGATIRAIAQRAGVSVGSVFTTFASKGDILSIVMEDRLAALYAELDRVMCHLRGSTADRLRSMFAIHIAFEAQHARLFLAHIAAAYDCTLPKSAKPFGATPRLTEMVHDCLKEGVARGDVRDDCDLPGVVDLLVAAYAWTYRAVITENADQAALTQAMDRRIGLLALGFATR